MRQVELYDTTLRDGTQYEGISLSAEDKIAITLKLDQLGVHYVEGGWPGSNPKDAEYFEQARASALTVPDSLCWAHDLEAALTWIQANPQVDEKKTMLLGSSMGAAVAIYVAAHRKEVAGLVSFASPAMMSRRDDPAQAIERLRELGVIRDEDFPSSLDAWNGEYETLNPMQWIAEISPRPLLILQGDADDVVPHLNASLLFEKAGEPKQLQLLPGVGHRFRQEEAAISASLEWLKRTFPA